MVIQEIFACFLAENFVFKKQISTLKRYIEQAHDYKLLEFVLFLLIFPIALYFLECFCFYLFYFIWVMNICLFKFEK